MTGNYVNGHNIHYSIMIIMSLDTRIQEKDIIYKTSDKRTVELKGTML